MTLADLRRALDDKERELRALLARKEALAAEVDELGETLVAMLAGTGVARVRRAAPNGHRKAAARAPSEKSLPTAIRSVLERVLGPMRVGEIADAVVKSGYVSKSRNLGIIVANRLSQMKDVEKIERGLYQLRRAAVESEAASSPSS